MSDQKSDQKPAVRRAGVFRAIVKTFAALSLAGLAVLFVVFGGPRVAKTL